MNLEEQLEEIGNQIIELKAERDELATKSKNVQSLQADLKLKLKNRLSSSDFNALTKQRRNLSRERDSVETQLRKIKIQIQKLSTKENTIKRAIEKQKSNRRSEAVVRGVENLDPTNMTIIELLLACYASFAKLDRRNVIGPRERAIMKKIEPYVQDQQERSKQIERNIQAV